MNFRLTIFPALEAGNPSASYLFTSKCEMEAAENTCADLLLFMQDKAKIMDDYSNMFLKEQHIDGEWQEMDD